MESVDWDFLSHKQALQIHGIYVPGTDPLQTMEGRKIFRFFRLSILPEKSSDVCVPLKLSMVPRQNTPYSFVSGELFYNGEKLCPKGMTIRHAPLLPEENTWHLKGYTFPFEGTPQLYKELRLNLRISGSCPGRCRFCHRWHSHRLKPDGSQKNNPRKILARLLEDEGGEVLKKVRRMLVISELFGLEKRFLNSISSTRDVVDKFGYGEDKPFGCSASDVRGLEGLKTLHTLIRPSRYSFSLEFFSGRDRYMGHYKGLPMDRVYPILENARKAGFREIQLNYLAGIDSLEELYDGMKKLVELGLVDSLGLSTFTAFSQEQLDLRHESAWDPLYYHQAVNVFNRLGIKVFRPESFDMGTPYSVLMEKTE